ncbi:MAG TPA: hypothetical protein VGL90_04500, partial [Casimicrobiaceae bacterium]
LAAGASYPAITLSVNVTANAPPSVTNVASVSGGGENNAANDVASDPTTIAPVVVPVPADLAITNAHVGTFSAGQVGAQFVVGVSNVGSGATSGAVSVSYTVPAGLTATAISGTGWSCSVAPLACVRSDALAAGANYPAISVTVDVAADASSPLTTVAIVSNAGDANAANDVAPDVVDVGRHLRRRRLLLRRFPLRPSLALRYRFRRWTNGR